LKSRFVVIELGYQGITMTEISPTGQLCVDVVPWRDYNESMHRSRINGLLIDCKTDDIDAAAQFWAVALGRPVDLKHPGSRGKYRMLETPPDELNVQIQRVDHESRVHIDIETDDIPAEVARLEKLGAKVDERKERWVIMRAPTGQRFCIVRVQRTNWPKNANQWD
jgi:predicted enzyme related to lactoylglutathione lyase